MNQNKLDELEAQTEELELPDDLYYMQKELNRNGSN